MSARKDPEERTRRGAPVYDDLKIAWDGKLRGPQLPSGYNWCKMTRRWWEMIRKSPQAMSFHETDWYHMLETADLHNRLWGQREELDSDGRKVLIRVKPTEASTLAGEIRRRTEPYGFTWADRRKYGIRITSPDEVQSEAETLTRNAVDYRARLNGTA